MSGAGIAFKITSVQFIVIITYAVIMGASQIFMSNASRQIGTSMHGQGFLLSVLSSWWLYLTIALYVIATSIWLVILFRVDIRIAYPIASTSVIFASIIQSIIEQNFPSATYWIGLLFIIVGLGLINIR